MVEGKDGKAQVHKDECFRQVRKHAEGLLRCHLCGWEAKTLFYPQQVQESVSP